jgi:voltage-gated potassium channel
MTQKRAIRNLYEGEGRRAHQFRYGLLAFDLFTIAFIIGTSFFERTPLVEAIDAVIGVVLLADFAARMWVSDQRIKDLMHPFGLADIAVIVSLLAPIFGEGFAFLRILRIVRLLRSYQLLKRLRQDFEFFERNEQAVLAALNLAVFIFIATAVVYETQHGRNPNIVHYLDALYFTVTTLTTTGYGDITLLGTGGRLLAVVMMISGISLFLRLVQVMIRPIKVEHKCPDCGLKRHDTDAVHCKACGRMLAIEDDGVE